MEPLAVLAVAAAAELGMEAATVEPLDGDASARRFFRLWLDEGSTVVAAVYPDGGEAAAARDAGVARWAWARRLPIPRPLGVAGRVTIAEDLGREELAAAVDARGAAALEPAIDVMAAFQRCPWQDAPSPPFDAAFFRAELEGFTRQLATPLGSASEAFLDDLAGSLGSHPFRLLHRDFHANNLMLRGNAAVVVDFQDLRGGPDTYDLVSLLRERAGGRLPDAESRWLEESAQRLLWGEGWRERYSQCAAQRGLKVVGTFTRLAAGGRHAYLSLLPAVKVHARRALEALDAPGELVDRLDTVAGV